MLVIVPHWLLSSIPWLVRLFMPYISLQRFLRFVDSTCTHYSYPCIIHSTSCYLSSLRYLYLPWHYLSSSTLFLCFQWNTFHVAFFISLSSIRFLRLVFFMSLSSFRFLSSLILTPFWITFQPSSKHSFTLTWHAYFHAEFPCRQTIETIYQPTTNSNRFTHASLKCQFLLNLRWGGGGEMGERDGERGGETGVSEKDEICVINY